MRLGTSSFFLREKRKSKGRRSPCNHMKAQNFTPHRCVPAHLLCKGNNRDLMHRIAGVGCPRNAFRDEEALGDDTQHDANGVLCRSCERHALGGISRQYVRGDTTGVYEGASSRKEKALYDQTSKQVRRTNIR